MSPSTPVVLDACVLVPRLLCDLLLRLAERPSPYQPKWSDQVLQEVERNQVRLGLPVERARSWQIAVAASFPEARVEGHEGWLERCHNDPKDRHVLAAAIVAEASSIVTFNLRDFPEVALKPWGIDAWHPSAFLQELYADDPEAVVPRLAAMARNGYALEDVLSRLRIVVPSFATTVARDLDLVLT